MRPDPSSLPCTGRRRQSAVGSNGRLLVIVTSWTLSLAASVACWVGLIRLVTVLVAGR